MMHKDKKKTYVEEMKSFFKKTSSVFVTHYQGLTVKQIDELRSEMRKKGILFKITKNRITKLALEGSKYKKLENLFTGPTAVAFSEDAITSAKILTKFAKKNSNLKIIGGIMEEEPLSLEEVQKNCYFAYFRRGKSQNSWNFNHSSSKNNKYFACARLKNCYFGAR